MIAEEQAFKINSYVVTDNTAKKIQEQIEYYFSLANLISDHFLRSIINCSLGGWVKTEIFCTFKKINSILENEVSENLKNGEIKTIIAKACASSTVLQVNKFAIRKKSLEKGIKDFSQVLYCENIEINNFNSILQWNNFDLDKITIQKGNSWFFVEFKIQDINLTMIANDILSKINPQLHPSIILGNKFHQLQIQYARIVGITPYQRKSRQNQKTNFIQAGRIQTYQQLIAQQKQKKTKKIKLKHKYDKTRLPSKYILGAVKKKQVVIAQDEINRAFDKIPELKQERQKNINELRQYQKRKMQQRLQKKSQLRKKSGRMEAEQQQMQDEQA